ncbi:MAG: Asp-tRNA(Asn)/Glu-tRNA(Gln) amidotransferase subunit GatC [Candidatus Algichlamydia australiensis]|nr:Asp-tRNA(Asn)/Glu-tRNA(Gln) amidotransferase subunit GatC [Chlamydiales bacterium]
MEKNDLKKLAHLCRLSCSDKELDEAAVHLEKVFEHANKLQEVDTDGVAPCHVVLEGLQMPLRDDVEEESLTRKEFLSNSPEEIGGMLRTPPVLAKEEE